MKKNELGGLLLRLRKFLPAGSPDGAAGKIRGAAGVCNAPQCLQGL